MASASSPVRLAAVAGLVPMMLLAALLTGCGIDLGDGSSAVRRANDDAGKVAYFGDLHVHTKISADSFLQGAVFGMEDAYRFAAGEQVEGPDGKPVQLSRPLDFVAITDHSENFSFYDLCVEGSGPVSRSEACRIAHLQRGTADYLRIDDFRSEEGCGGGPDKCADAVKRTWHRVVSLADKYNRPGILTTFPGYEFSAAGGEGGYSWHMHRNVIFNGKSMPDTVFSALDSNLNTELWKWLELRCAGDCDVVAIPHNMNLSSGFAFALETTEGKPYTATDWKRRERFERLVEIYQIKGDSECRSGLGAIDEYCSFEQFEPDDPMCEPGQSSDEMGRCVDPGNFTRNGLLRGLGLAQSLGFNPFSFGFVGSTDNHNAMPGATMPEEYRGWRGTVDAIAPLRALKKNITSVPGGLAGVWAQENTRASLFAAMKARETFGTSGSRVKVRMFGSFAWPELKRLPADWITRGYREGVPMGSRLPGGPGPSKPSFMVWAEADLSSAPLERLQIVKGWMTAAGTLEEKVYDVACANGRMTSSGTGSCKGASRSVDMASCTPDTASGASLLASAWHDPDYNPGEPAFYYVRAIEVPTCRWSTWEALKTGAPISPLVKPTVQLRAWGSPIWTAVGYR